MKKLGALILGAILTIGIGAGISVKPATDVAKAGSDVLAYTLDGTVIGKGSSYTGDNEVTQNDITWVVNGNTNINPWRLGGKSSNCNKTDRHIYSKSAVSGNNITKVVVNTGNIDSVTVHSFTLNVGTTAKANDLGSIVAASCDANSTITFEKPAEADWSNAYFDLVFNLTSSNASKNKFIQFKSAEFYYESNLSVTSIEVTSNPTKTEYAFGEALDLDGLVITANWSSGTEEDVTANCEFTPAEGTLLTEDTTVVATYQGQTTSFDVTVEASDAVATDKFITATTLGYGNSYSSNSSIVDSIIYGRVDALKNSSTGALQLKATTGAFFNISAMPANIKTVIVAFDADNDYAPSNYAVYAGTTSADKSTKITGTAIDETNYVYSFDFSGGEYQYFTIAKTGSYATYIDMLAIELDSALANSVRAAAKTINDALDAECAALDVKESTWSTLAESITDTDVIDVLKETELNTAPSNGTDSVQLTGAQKALARYDYIVAKYGYNNFLSREVAASYGVSIKLNSDNTTIIIVISIILIGAASLVVFKSKKNKYSK